jgi:hypothetical protein
MLQIGIALSAVFPLVLEHRLVRAFRLWAATVFRVALGFGVATLVYFAVLFAIVATFRLSQPLGVAVYGAGFSVATLLSVVAASLAVPTRLARIFIPGICVLTVMFPVGLNWYFGIIGVWRPAYLLYLAGGLCGGYAVALLVYRVHGGLRLCGI